MLSALIKSKNKHLAPGIKINAPHICLSGKCQKGTNLLVLVIHRLKNLHLRDLTLLSSLAVGLSEEPFSFCPFFYLICMHFARIGADVVDSA